MLCQFVRPTWSELESMDSPKMRALLTHLTPEISTLMLKFFSSVGKVK